MVEELDASLAVIEADDEIKVLIITGVGDKAFIVGADITELNKRDFILRRKHTKRRQEVFNRLAELAIPSIAAINVMR